MNQSSRLHTYSFIRIFSSVSAAALLLVVFASSALAQTDLNGENKTITPPTTGADWSTSFTNTSENLSTITFSGLENKTRYDYTKTLTGAIAVDVTHQGYANNDNRFTISNTGNTFTGGVTMHNGILFVTNSNQLVSFSGGLALDNAVFMAYGDCNFDVTIPSGAFGGMRASGGNIVLNQKVTGSGDLVIVTENSGKVTLNGANDYAGVTSIGTVQGGANLHAYLILGANNTLPSTTVVEIGKSQNSKYSYASASTANLDLNGKTQTIAGLYGAGKASITNGTAAEANLTINPADGKSYEYSGTITGNSATNLTNLSVTGAGNQTLSGNISNASLTKSGTGTLTLGADSVSLASLAVNEGTLAFTPNVNLTVSGNVTSASALDLNGANLTYTSNVATDFNNAAINNTNTETQSVLTIAPTSDVNQQTFNKSVSGNTRLVVKLYSNENNNSRLVLSGTNTHTGGLYIEQGTARVDNYSSLGTVKQIDFKNGCLMTTQDFDGYTINLTGTDDGDRGAIRRTGTNSENFKAKITGVGSLEIVNDNTVILFNTSNDYQGKTYIGNYGWRSNGLGYGATLKLGASGVLPDATVVQFGGGKVSGTQTLDLAGFAETVAGISDSNGKGVITSDSAATLTVNANADYTYKGKVTGSATLEKKGTGTLTVAGNSTGSFVVNEGKLVLAGDNTGSPGIEVGVNGTLVYVGANSAGSLVTMKGGTLHSYFTPLSNTSIAATQGDSTIILGQPVGTYARQLLTGTSKDMTYFTAPEFISNMDKIANTAYVPGSANYFTADIWGSTTGDQNNTNLLQTSVVNTTDSPITLDFAYQFHNSAYLAVIDSEGNRTVVMDWATSSAHTVDGGTYSFATNTGSYTFEPGEAYTIEARIFRFNRTIGANGGGLNGFDGTLVGLGARVSGTTGEYLPLNFDGDNWTFSDGSFTFSNQVNFSAPVTINSEASLTFDVPNNDLAVSSAISGAGTLNVNPAEGFTHTFSGAIEDTVVIAKSGEGTMTLTGDCQSIGSITVGTGTLDVAFDDVNTALIIDSIAMAENTAFKVTKGTVAFEETNVVLNNLSGGSLKDDGTIDVASGISAEKLTLNNDELTKFIGLISSSSIEKTGDGTLQLYAEASQGGIQADSFIVSSGRLDMKEYFSGTLEVGENLGNDSYTTAVLSPGNSVGTLTVNGDYTLNPGSTLLIEIGKDEQGNVIADQLIVNGDATFMPGSIIDIVLDDASSLAGGETFEGDIIISNNEVNLDKVIIRSYYFDINVTQSGNIISLSAKLDPNAIPEPSTWALLVLGAAGLLFWRKRKNS